MAINETLKFSWGHIIAFVALIFISYFSFFPMNFKRSLLNNINDHLKKDLFENRLFLTNH